MKPEDLREHSAGVLRGTVVCCRLTKGVLRCALPTLFLREDEDSVALEGEVLLDVPEGHLNYTLQLDRRAVARGARLTVTATWFTAARDRLQESLELPLRDSLWRATLAVTADTDGQNILPHWPFDVILTLHSDAGTSAGVSPPPPPAVEFRLVPLPDAGVAPGTPRARLFDRGTPIAAAGSVDRGSPTRHYRTVTLPSVARYRLVARVTDATGATLYPSVDVGRTRALWRRTPLSALPTAAPRFEAVAEGGAAQQYGPGEDAVLVWRSPFARGRALLHWGNTATGWRTWLYEVPAGDNKFSFRVGCECRRGCRVQGYVLGYGTAEEGPVAVPKSQLWDSALPQLVRFQPLDVPLRDQQAALQLDIDVGGGRALPGTGHNVTFRYAPV